MKSYELLTSLQNPIVKKICLLKKDGAVRQKERVTIVEGKNLLIDLLPKAEASALFVTEKNISSAGNCKKLYVVSQEIMNKISTVESPEGMLALYPIQDYRPQSIDSPCLILDGIQDPGNMGTLLRTASAFGMRYAAVITPSCDLWHPKVIRSAKGAHFFFDALVTTSWDILLPILSKKNIPLLVATLHAQNIHTIPIPEKWALVIGSEAHGPSLPSNVPMLTFSIPIAAHIDSLNAAQAGAIVLYALSTKKNI